VRKLPVENPASRFQQFVVDYDPGETPDAEYHLFDDDTRRVLSENSSPDIGFRYSLNPYRGCLHGCAYCYARPTHEYLGFGAGSDFERKIVVKRRAPELLREAFERKNWQGELIVFSGNTDCYQPIEQRLGLTRGCLSVCAEYRNPVHVITKGTLVERDIDVLSDLAVNASAGVTISIPFLDAETARAIEPYAPPPARRFEALRRLSAAGIPVSVNVAPLIPGLNDHELVPILEAASEAGATSAGLVPLRLPGAVEEVFVTRLEQLLPLRANKVLTRVREMRGGKLYDSRFGARMRGEGRYLDTVFALFDVTKRRLGMDRPEVNEPRSTFRRPSRSPQLSLFEE
jgi:DNA repair photolyase